jgi:hypothetical protein
MFWSSLVVAMIIVGLVTLLFALLRKGVHDRQEARHEARQRREALQQRELESVGVRRAIRHFRHDMGNQLGQVFWAYEVVRTGLDNADPAGARQALEDLYRYAQEFMTFVRGFDVDADGERPSEVDMSELVRQMSRPFAGNGTEVCLGPGLKGWYVSAPPVSLTMVVGNLIKNACEAARRVEVDRRGEALVVENPVAAADKALLADGSAFAEGTSGKGEGRGTGLDSAREAASRCGADLSAELLARDGVDWVRFRLAFPDAPS